MTIRTGMLAEPTDGNVLASILSLTDVVVRGERIAGIERARMWTQARVSDVLSLKISECIDENMVQTDGTMSHTRLDASGPLYES